MSFHKQIERQLAQEFSPNEATILIDYQDAVFHGRRLQAQAMGLAIAKLYRIVTGALKQLLPARALPSITPLNNHLRQDIGLLPRGAGSGLYRE